MPASMDRLMSLTVPSAHEDGSRVKTVKENAIGAKSGDSRFVHPILQIGVGRGEIIELEQLYLGG